MRRAFTLIELVVAIGLSTAVCAAAWATLRLCSTSLSVADRLSLENGLLREGMSAALEDLDFWTSYDDPADAANQPLRKPGRPFAPLDPRAGGFDTAFDPSDPKTWFRGVGGSTSGANWWGQYAQHAGLAYVDSDPAKQRERRWTANLLNGMSLGIGYYGMIDYLPAGTPLLFFNASGELQREFWDSYSADVYSSDPATCIKEIMATSGERHTPRDALGDITLVYTVTKNPDYLARDVDHHYFYMWKHISFFEDEAWWQAHWVHERCGEPLSLMPVGPSAWPSLAVTTYHVDYSGRELNNASVTIASPVTGQRIKLYLSSLATTLRGARRQRGLDANELP